jgi:endonuclease/exonuclease/phosphatase family metal-dependent hydrolase
MKQGAETYRVVSWNLNHGAKRDEQWRFLLEQLDPDLAVLQEARLPPPWVAERGGALVFAPKAPGSGRGTAIYVRRPPLRPIRLANQDGYFAAARLRLPGGRPALALSVHGRTDRSRPGGHYYLTNYLRPEFDALASQLNNFRGRCFVGGDFNLSRGLDEAYGYRLEQPRSHGGFFSWLERKHNLIECCCTAGEKRSLYRKGPRHPDYQLDHLFVSRTLAGSRGSCKVLDWELDGLSDHAPVVADFSAASL